MPGRSRYHLSTANLSSYEDRFKQLYWRIIWTHMIHEKQADISEKLYSSWERPCSSW